MTDGTSAQGTAGIGLFDQGESERAAGRMDDAAALFAAAIDAFRDVGDESGWIRAALGLASTQVLGAEPGDIPARLHDLHVRLAPGPDRARVAAALAKSWGFAGEPKRAAVFADEALTLTHGSTDPQVRGLALNAALLARSGPDDIDVRHTLTEEFLDLAAHERDPVNRLRAHRWGFEIAAADLDLAAMNRHLLAIERIESPRARFFATSRRMVLDLLRDKLDTGEHLMAMTLAAGREAKVADTWMTVATLRGPHAMQSGDAQLCRDQAHWVEDWATQHGVPVALGNAALLWLGAGEPERAAAVLGVIAGPALARQPRDANWLPTVHQALWVATQVGAVELAAQAEELLRPYQNRSVWDVGAAAFYGLTDDALARAAHLYGDPREARRLRDRALAAYRRVGAGWWAAKLLAAVPDAGGTVFHLASGGGAWRVGRLATPVGAMRGFSYLQTLLGKPGVDFSALDLVGANRGHASVQQHDVGEVADRRALAAYRTRIEELQAEIDMAREWSDIGRLEFREAEYEALLAEVARATGLGGSPRSTGSSGERARVAVRKAIVKAIDRIAEVDAECAAHLRRQVRTGSVCRYEPGAEPVEWLFA